MKFRNLILGLAIVALSLCSFAQSNLTTAPPNRLTVAEGVYNALAYQYEIPVFGLGSTSSGTYSISLYAPGVTLKDGRIVAIFGGATIPPIWIGSGANAEVVTPTASGCSAVNTNVASQGTCVLTATFAHGHGRGDLIHSGDAGYQEAINDASWNGGGQVFWQFDSGTMTLATGGATTTYTQGNFGGPVASKFFPSLSFVMGVTGIVETAITGCSSGWEIGDGTTANRWTTALATFTAGTTATNTGAAWDSAIASATTGIRPSADKSLVITCTGSNASAGAIKVRAWGYTPVASAF